MKKEKSCGAIVYRLGEDMDQVEYLLIRHVNGGHWAFTKGHVEAGESESDTALRKIREETGLEVELDQNFRQVNTYSPAEGIEKDVIYFIAQSLDQAVTKQTVEVSDFAWLPYEEALDRLTYSNDQGILKLAQDYLTQDE
ncbi:bis(5'-nucleosyl)-tetraphosphatase [Hutsoniella sourekii]